jgi:hypothetical protein
VPLSLLLGGLEGLLRADCTTLELWQHQHKQPLHMSRAAVCMQVVGDDIRPGGGKCETLTSFWPIFWPSRWLEACDTGERLPHQPAQLRHVSVCWTDMGSGQLTGLGMD